MNDDYISPPENLPSGSVVWAYLRDSGGDSQEQSVPQQREEIKAYCASHNLILAHVFADVAKSGGSVDGRQAFEDMFDMSGDSDLRPRGLLLWNFARFARDLDDSSYYKALLRKRGIIVHSLTDPIPDGVYGRVVETLIDIANEEKRRQTARDVKRALSAQVRQGYSCGGSPPRGYISVPEEIGLKRDGSARVVSRWVPNPQLWDLVKLAWKMRSEGASYLQIQEATKGLLYNNVSSWHSFFINKTYLGIGKCGDLEVLDHHEAAIDFDTWEKVQAERRSQRTAAGHPNHPRRVSNPSLLSGLAFCSHCGHSMIRQKTKQKNGGMWHYYVCGKKINHSYGSCEGRQVNALRADEIVLDTVLNRVLTSEFLTRLLQEAKELFQDTRDLDQDILDVQKSLAKNDMVISNLLDLAEAFGARAAGERLKEREIDRDKLNKKLKDLQSKRIAAQVEITPEAIQAVLGFWREEIILAAESKDILSLKMVLRRFVTRIDLEYNKCVVYYKFPIDSLMPALRVNIADPRGGMYVLGRKAIVVEWS